MKYILGLSLFVFLLSSCSSNKAIVSHDKPLRTEQITVFINGDIVYVNEGF